MIARADGRKTLDVLSKKSTTTMTSEWLVPSTRSEVIEDLVSGVGQSLSNVDIVFPIFNFLSDRYNPSNIGILEDYLYHQIRSEEYDCLANLAVLKLYVF